MNTEGIVSLVVLACSVSAVSLTITKAKVFEWLRNVMAKWKYPGELFKCSYCMSHWVSFILVAVYRPVVIRSPFWILDLAVSAFMVVSMATMISWLVYNAYKKLDVESALILQLRQALQKAQEKIVEQDRLLKADREKVL